MSIDATSRAMQPGIRGAMRTTAPVAATPRDEDSQLRNAAGQLEGLFVQQLFKVMRETVPQSDGIVSGGAGEEIFTGLLDQHLAAETPKQWESGIADALYRQLRGVGAASPSVTPSSPAASASPSNTEPTAP